MKTEGYWKTNCIVAGALLLCFILTATARSEMTCVKAGDYYDSEQQALTSANLGMITVVPAQAITHVNTLAVTNCYTDVNQNLDVYLGSADGALSNARIVLDDSLCAESGGDLAQFTFDMGYSGTSCTVTAYDAEGNVLQTENPPGTTTLEKVNFVERELSYMVLEGGTGICITNFCWSCAGMYAVDDTATTTMNTPVGIPVMDNDVGPQDALLKTIDSGPSHGTAVIEMGQVTYTPASGYTGTDSFVYTMGTGGWSPDSDSATVTVTITAGSDPQGDYTYYIPFFTSTSGWWTGLGTANAGTSTAKVEVTAYSQSGSVLNTQSESLPAKGQKAFLLDVSTFKAQDGWLKVVSTEPLVGVCFVADDVGPSYMMDVPFVHELKHELWVPHVAQNKEWDTSVMVANPNSTSNTINLTFVNPDGTQASPKSYTLPPNGSGVYALSDILSGASKDMGYVKITGKPGFTAFALYNNLKTGGYSYAGILAADPTDQP